MQISQIQAPNQHESAEVKLTYARRLENFADQEFAHFTKYAGHGHLVTCFIWA
jgi:hypothetical protein